MVCQSTIPAWDMWNHGILKVNALIKDIIMLKQLGAVNLIAPTKKSPFCSDHSHFSEWTARENLNCLRVGLSNKF